MGQVSSVHYVKPLSAIIDVLKEENLHLIDKVKQLKERSVQMDYNLCKSLSEEQNYGLFLVCLQNCGPRRQKAMGNSADR